MNPDLSEDLQQIVEGVCRHICVRLRKVEYEWNIDGVEVTGTFLYLPFRDGQATVSEFADYLYKCITEFCIPRAKRQAAAELFERTREFHHMQDLLDQAKHLFVRARASLKTTGEPGEVILFALLEGLLGAPQLACKMYLKTSEQVPVHGSDSIHVTVGSTDGSIQLIWGESKLYRDLPAALEEVCVSIADFRREVNGRSPRSRDIDIIKDHVNLPPGALKDALMEYFDPYSEASNHREEAWACFVGFDFDEYVKCGTCGPRNAEELFLGKYRARIESACELFLNKLEKHGLNKLRLYFFLVPFPRVEELREAFLAKLGATS